MKTTKLLPIIALISFAILVQNTCPYGMAAKIGFIAKEVHHCPLKKHSPEKADSADSAKKVIFQAGQAFVFAVGGSINAVPLSLPEVSCSFSEMNFYKNIFVEPPVKPPIFV